MKLHRREIHEEGTFACFVCNNKFKTHKQLKAHIQRKCKSQSAPKQISTIVHKRNDDILPEDEHRCPQCPKITNNQVPLVHHINTEHMTAKEKCDTCGRMFPNREALIKHIVDNHTEVGMQQQQRVQVVQGGRQQQGQYGGNLSEHMLQRYKCQVCGYETNSQNELKFHNECMHQQAVNKCFRCNIELNEYNTKENHTCRLPQDDQENTCNFCKNQFVSRKEKMDHICKNHLFKTVDQQRREKQRASIECNNGPSCWRAARNKCSFKHSEQVSLLPHMGQRQGQEYAGARSQKQQYCKYQENCFKVEQSCRYKHINQGFPQNNPSQRNQ